MAATSEISISKSAYKQNVDFIKSLIGQNCTFSSVVKGNAYGHSIEKFIPMAEEIGVNNFSIFSAFEAEKAKSVSNGKSNFLIMGVCDYLEELEWCILNEIHFFVYDFERLENAIKTAKKLQKKAFIHIELETGMNRTGFNQNSLLTLIKVLQENKAFINYEGLCTHFAGAESITNYLRVKNQIINYAKAEKLFKNNAISFKYNHLACSAGVVNYPNTIRNFVRVGIMQYGFWSNRETEMNYFSRNQENYNPLKRVISWKSYVMGVKQVKAREFIGYGTSVMAEKDMQIATIPVGYSHGFSRSLSNQGKVLIRGVRLDVIGVINMNMMIVDASNLPNIQKNESVVLIGNQGENSITVDAFGELSTQLNYELLTRLPNDIPRKIID